MNYLHPLEILLSIIVSIEVLVGLDPDEKATINAEQGNQDWKDFELFGLIAGLCLSTWAC